MTEELFNGIKNDSFRNLKVSFPRPRIYKSILTGCNKAVFPENQRRESLVRNFLAYQRLQHGTLVVSRASGRSNQFHGIVGHNTSV